MSTAAIVAGRSRRRKSLWTTLRGGDEVAHLITLAFAASVFLVTIFLVWELWLHSGPSRHKFGFSFLTGTDWDPVRGIFGALPYIYGTVVTSVVAMMIAIPLGVGAAVFLAELAPPRLSNGCTFLVELLAAVPSVIYGLLAMYSLVPLLRSYGEPFLKATLGFLPFFQGPAFGVGYLAAGLILAIMTPRGCSRCFSRWRAGRWMRSRRMMHQWRGRC